MATPGLTAWRALVDTLQAVGTSPRVYGGHGWQRITGLAYLHAASDLDLLLSVADAAMADATVAALHAATFSAPRLDGEIVFPDGSAVAWREWQAWRAGRVKSVLVKQLDGVAMASQLAQVSQVEQVEQVEQAQHSWAEAA